MLRSRAYVSLYGISSKHSKKLHIPLSPVFFVEVPFSLNSISRLSIEHFVFKMFSDRWRAYTYKQSEARSHLQYCRRVLACVLFMYQNTSLYLRRRVFLSRRYVLLNSTLLLYRERSQPRMDVNERSSGSAREGRCTLTRQHSTPRPR